MFLLDTSVLTRLRAPSVLHRVEELDAAVAEATSLTVLHYDADFDHIAAITGQSTECLVDLGSID